MRKVQPASVMWVNQIVLIRAIKKVWARIVGQSDFAGVNQVVGMSIIVGIIIFNIVGG